MDTREAVIAAIYAKFDGRPLYALAQMNSHLAGEIADIAIAAHLKALAAEGMVVVPREPTEAMLKAPAVGYISERYAAYRAMIQETDNG